MRLFFILLVGLLFSMDQVQAQFGVRVGLHRTSSTLKIDDESQSTTWLNRLAFGISYEQKISDQLRFRPEILFSQYGVGSQDETDPDASLNLTMNFIQMPLLLKYHATNSLFFEAGPYLAYGVGDVNTRICIPSPNGEFCQTTTAEFDSTGEDGPKPFDYGASLGLGYEIINNVSIGVRYNLGLANLAVDDVSYLNKSLLISVAYSF